MRDISPEVHHYHCIHESEFATDLAAKINKNGQYAAFLIESPGNQEQKMFRENVLLDLLSKKGMLTDYVENEEDALWTPQTFSKIEGHEHADVRCIDGDYTMLKIEDFEDFNEFAVKHAIQHAERDATMTEQTINYIEQNNLENPIALLTGADHTMVTTLLRMSGIEVIRLYSPEGLDDNSPPPLGRMQKIRFDPFNILLRKYLHGIIDRRQLSNGIEKIIRPKVEEKKITL